MMRPNATAATHPELARVAQLLAHSTLSRIEQLQLLLDHIAPIWQADRAEAVSELGRSLRLHMYEQFYSSRTD